MLESAISQVQTGNKFSALSSIIKVKNGVSCPVSCFVAVEKKLQKKGIVLRVKCGGKEVSSLNWEKEEEEEEMIGMKKLINEKCKQGDGYDGVGIVELLECLEKEAIMGEDKGRDPNDYNRRALIFDKSSRVFQALKHVQKNNTSL